MNDRRFTELLNLYLDHELEPADAAELEAEVMGNPVRRQTYDQYCRLQRACSLLGEKERSHAPEYRSFTRSLRAAERKIAAPRRSAWSPAYLGGFAATAMAACVAVIVIVNRSSDSSQADDGLADSVQPEQVASTVPAPTTAPAPAQPIAPSFDVQPAFAATGLGAVRNAREAEIAANDREALEWMQRVELSATQRVVVDEQAFEPRPVLQPDNRVFRGRHSLQSNAEFTAFQFQR